MKTGWKRVEPWLGLAVAGGGLALAALAGLVAYNRAADAASHPGESDVPWIANSTLAPSVRSETAPGFLYGRVTTDRGTYEGRLRWGSGEEAFWGDYFNALKDTNPWADRLPPAPKTAPPFSVFGFEFGARQPKVNLGRPFMARFGDIARIESRGPFVVRVTLKSGTVYDLPYMEANDFADGVRIWRLGSDASTTLPIVDVDALEIRAIDFLPTAWRGPAPDRLHGTVRSRQGVFTGTLQWNRSSCVGADTLTGRAADGPVSARFDSIRSIVRRSSDSTTVTLVDGRELMLSGSRDTGRGNLGVYVDDPRYGRVLVTWDAFERVDFSPGDSGPAYDKFPPGQSLSGSVTTRDGRRLSGRLVYDLDESETTDTLDAPARGVDYTVPFGLVASIALPRAGSRSTGRATVTLQSGEALELDLTGDLAETNGGVLVLVDDGTGGQRSEYVAWADVQTITFDRPHAMYPPFGAG